MLRDVWTLEPIVPEWKVSKDRLINGKCRSTKVYTIHQFINVVYTQKDIEIYK
jgi:hypothetical protein